jgi:hypothetical protein
MSSEIERTGTPETIGDTRQGPSLTLLYTILVLGLLAAIGCAALIVLPFYRHR